MKIFSKIFLLSCVVFIFGCESLKKRSEMTKPGDKQVSPQIPSALRAEPSKNAGDELFQLPTPINTHAPEAVGVGQAPPKIAEGERPRIGLILGPGGLRAYAHIGVLEELVKAKIPIQGIVGLEMGALVGGIFANKGQTYDVEWQMMKLREEDFFNRSFISGSKPQEVSALNNFLTNVMGNSRTEETKINFACPSYNISKRKIYMMNRGPLVSLLPFCIPFTPLFRPYQQNVAGLNSVAASAKYLKSKGANYLIYVDLLNEKTVPYFANDNSDENVSWSMVAETIDSQLFVFNKVITVPLQKFYLNDFDQRREILQRGQDAGRIVADKLLMELRM